MKILKLLPFSAIVLGALTTPASADWHGGHHWWGGSRTQISVGVGGYPYGYGYYRPYPYYYEARPSVVYVDRARGSVEVDVQRELRRKGYYGGPVDGDIGPQTRAAIRAYQVDKALPVTGRIDTPLLSSLRLL
ncbi:MAG: peptidoglycan-binding domain-containing protein [Verrucomicrobiota bacterium]